MKDIRFFPAGDNLYCLLGVDWVKFYSRQYKKNIEGLRFYLFDIYFRDSDYWTEVDLSTKSCGAQVFSYWTDNMTWKPFIKDVPGIYRIETKVFHPSETKATLTKLEFVESAGFYSGELPDWVAKRLEEIEQKALTKYDVD